MSAQPAPSVQSASHTAEMIEEAITSRRSIRAFLPTAVPDDLVKRILEISARAPSGTNMQPWKVHVVTGAALERLSSALNAAHTARTPSKAEYKYYPDAFFEPYQSRRRAVGLQLYSLLDIAKGDTERMLAQAGRNYSFFDAPVGMMFTIDRKLEIGSWLDYGMFLQNIMVAARAHGLDTCPQAAFANHHETIRQHLPISQDDVVVCGMALGYADTSKPENTLISARAPLAEFASFHDN